MTTPLTITEIILTTILFFLIILIAFLTGELWLSINKIKTLSEEVKTLKRKLKTKTLTASLDKSATTAVAVAALGVGLISFLERRKEKKVAKELAEKKELELVEAVSFGWSYASFSPNKKNTLDECVNDYRNKFNNNQH